jgi:sulfur-oxidizing protein SoxA
MKPGIIITSLSFLLLVGCNQQAADKSDNTAAEKNANVGTTISAPDTADYQKLVAADAAKFKSFYTEKFPDVDPADFKNGVYAIDEESREQWLEIEDFPPYELSVDDGQVLFETPFANGKGYKDCFGDGAVRQNYPRFDELTKQVITLDLAINNCRTSNGEPALPYGEGEIIDVSAFIAFKSRGKIPNIQVKSEAAYNAYLAGKKFFYSKRGQLNMSCQNCHMGAFGTMLRADRMGPAYGHTTGFPVYRGAWEALGSLHKRYAECNRNVRAKPFAFQSLEYRNLEFFESLMSGDLAINGPSSRK